MRGWIRSLPSSTARRGSASRGVGAHLIQLRIKERSDAEVLGAAREAMKIVAPLTRSLWSTTIGDRDDAGADYVHLRQAISTAPT